jgi:predicted DsbA family dithiol-disulfide isomerase
VPTLDYLAGRFGPESGAMTARVAELAKTEGLDFDFGAALTVNTLDAHRLLHLAADLGVGAAAKERLLRAHFTEGADLSDHETLARLGGEVGLDPDRARAVLAGTEYDAEVRADLEEARRLGISGVPFFVFDRRYGVSGAQPAETFGQALRTAYAAEDLAP